MPSFDHDWMDVCFDETDYRTGYRNLLNAHIVNQVGQPLNDLEF